MRKKNFLFQSLIGGAVLAMVIKVVASRLTRAKPAPRRASGATSFEEIDAFVEAKCKHLNVPGAALAIVEGDKIVHLRGFGQARPGGEAPTPQTPFVLGSTTKSFTALAVMQLVEAGKIELDAPIQRYLPWFRVADPQASAQITVRHLLNQTSGLPVLSGWTTLANFDDRPDATERQARALSKLKLARPVGSAFEYNNTNYNVLGLIIEAASGESYSDYIQKHIFNPLGMSHSFTSQAAAKQDGLATGHRYWFWFPFAAPNQPIPRGSLPSGQLISSAEDMAHYLIAYLNGGRYGDVQILSGAGTRRAMQRGGGFPCDGRFGGEIWHGMDHFRHRPNEDHRSQRLRPRLFFLYGASARTKKRRGPAPQRRPFYDGTRHDRIWDGCGGLARRPAACTEPIWLRPFPPLGDAPLAGHPASPNRRRRRHAALVTPLPPGSGPSPES